MRTIITLMLLGLVIPAQASNEPCSGRKGGVVRCQGSKFLCKDGSLSASKRKCTKTEAANANGNQK